MKIFWWCLICFFKNLSSISKSGDILSRRCRYTFFLDSIIYPNFTKNLRSLRLTVAEILTFEVTLSEQNQQNLYFGHFWACIKFYFFFRIPPFWLKLLMFTYISIFHTCQSSRFRDMMVQSLKKRQFFNKNYIENFSKFLKKKIFKKVVFSVLDLGELDNSQLCWTPLWKPFWEKFLLIFFLKIWLKNWHF